MKLKKPLEIYFRSPYVSTSFYDDNDVCYTVSVEEYHYEDFGIGSYEFHGEKGYHSVPTCVIDDIYLESVFDYYDEDFETLEKKIKKAWDSGLITATCDYKNGGMYD